ncbi:MAG: hypothetical protein ACJ73D_08895 [Pyrinomonadaceae bacterium]
MTKQLRNVFITITLVLITGTALAAQGVHTPDKASPERKEILDALRIPVERDLKQRIVFVVENLNVAGTWAFVGGSPQGSDGGQPDYRHTPYAQAQKAGMFDNNFFALLKKTAGSWKVITYRIGCTDVCYATWWHDHRAPKAIFPYTE